MPMVRRMFALLADGYSLHGVKKTFEREGIPAPAGGSDWILTSMSRIIRNDVYRSHSYDEIAPHVSAEVIARLDPNERYGIAWYGQERVKQTEDLTPNGKYRRKFSKNPRNEWIAIPVPDAGVPREHVDEARAALESQPRRARPGDRFWELGGLMYCQCGARLTPYSAKDGRTGKRYSYYTCMKRRKHGKAACPDGVTCRTWELEELVMIYVNDLVEDPEQITRHIDETIAREASTLRNPDAEEQACARQIAECDRLRGAYQEQQAAGHMTLDELGARLVDLDERRAIAEKQLDQLRDGQKRIDQLKAQKRFVLETFGLGLKLGLVYFPPQMRRAIYEMLRLKITVSGHGSVHIGGNLDANVMRLSQDIEEYARMLREAEQRFLEQQRLDLCPEGSWDEVAEKELRAIRQELSLTTTDITSSLMSKLA